MSLGIHFSDIAKVESDTIYAQDFLIDSICTDTRSIVEGETFLAIKGESFDGHNYIDDAISSGASSIVLSDEREIDKPNLKVKDTVVTLGHIASIYRNKLSAKVIGITGSNGKTTVKGMLTCIGEAHGRTTATRANQNNTIGVPLTLLSADLQDEVVVVELGTSEAGEIAYLSNIVEPDIAVINNISESHLEGIGRRDDVFAEKSQIIRHTKQNGCVVLNADDSYTDAAKELAASKEVLTFGLEHDADVAGNYEQRNSGSQVTVSMPDGVITYHLRVPGRHNVENSLAAVAVAYAAQIDHLQIVKGLEEFSGVKGRLKISSLGSETWLIDDSYNANPSSTKAALDVLSGYTGRKIFVFGGMAELGPGSEQFHQEIGRTASEKGVYAMYGLSGDASAALDSFENSKHDFSDVDEMCKCLSDDIRDGDVILVKGSRRYRMDRVVKYLKEAVG